jgi:hypothetical protein
MENNDPSINELPGKKYFIDAVKMLTKLSFGAKTGRMC